MRADARIVCYTRLAAEILSLLTEWCQSDENAKVLTIGKCYLLARQDAVTDNYYIKHGKISVLLITVLASISPLCERQTKKNPHFCGFFF
jgi:hypothetical protein